MEDRRCRYVARGGFGGGVQHPVPATVCDGSRDCHFISIYDYYNSKLPLSDGEIDVAQNEACGENPYQPSNFAEFASSDFHHRIGDQPQAETSAMLKVNGVASMVMKDRTDSLNSLHSM